MRYVGGKSKIAKELSAVILANTQSRDNYLEPFVGGASIFAKLAPHFNYSRAGDFMPDVVELWNDVIHHGWEPPTDVSRELYDWAKTQGPSAIRGFIGFGGSFGGKWFGGYAKGGFNSDGSPRNHQAESARAILKIRDAVSDSAVGLFRNRSFEDWCPTARTVIYCDPPYAATQGYDTGKFDTPKFWDTVREWSASGCDVFVSEYEGPSDFECIWEKSHRLSLTTTAQGRPETIEKLFKYIG